MHFSTTFLHLHSRRFPVRKKVSDLRCYTKGYNTSFNLGYINQTYTYRNTHTNSSPLPKPSRYVDVCSRTVGNAPGVGCHCINSTPSNRLICSAQYKCLSRDTTGTRCSQDKTLQNSHALFDMPAYAPMHASVQGTHINIRNKSDTPSQVDVRGSSANASTTLTTVSTPDRGKYSVLQTPMRFYSQLLGSRSTLPAIRRTGFTSKTVSTPYTARRHCSTVSTPMVGTCSIINRRQHQEDRVTVAHLSPELSFFGCFDGHGGSFAADFAHRNVHKHLNKFFDEGVEVEEAIRRAIAKVDEQLNSIQHMQSGSTACMCVIHNNKLVVANIGDSVAFLCREAKALDLTVSHKPSIKEEKERIEACGGRVSCELDGVARVNERLAMSRALGDFSFRKYGVISEPDVGVFELTEKDCFLVLGTDGVFDMITSAQACAVVNSCEDPEEGAQELVSLAAQLGSHDNASAVVVRLEGWGLYENPDDVRLRAQAYSYNRGGRFRSLSHI